MALEYTWLHSCNINWDSSRFSPARNLWSEAVIYSHKHLSRNSRKGFLSLKLANASLLGEKVSQGDPDLGKNCDLFSKVRSRSEPIFSCLGSDTVSCRDEARAEEGCCMSQLVIFSGNSFCQLDLFFSSCS